MKKLLRQKQWLLAYSKSKKNALYKRKKAKNRKTRKPPTFLKVNPSLFVLASFAVAFQNIGS